MRRLGQLDFPDKDDQAETVAWTASIIVRALNRDVLAVAVSRIEGAWKAYIGAVAGRNHDEEWLEIRRSGATLPETVALAIFPEFAGVPYAR